MFMSSDYAIPSIYIRHFVCLFAKKSETHRANVSKFSG